MITISECKQQCSIESDLLDFDPWFRRTIPAVVAAIQGYLNRRVFETQTALDNAKTALDAGDTSLDCAMVVTEDLKHAMLMMIAHWFENREAASAMTIKDVPMGFEFLLKPYRLISV